KYEGQSLPNDLQIKLQILTFSNLFLRRYSPSVYLPSHQTLSEQRQRNANCARSWYYYNSLQTWSEGDAFHIPQNGHRLSKNRQDMMLHLGLPRNSTLCLEYQVSLLDVIPEYISLGHMLPQEIQPEWMKNAVHLMLHSAVEQVLILGETKVDKLAEGFAWDWLPDRNPLKTLGIAAQQKAWIHLRDTARSSSLHLERDVSVENLRRLCAGFPYLNLKATSWSY
ncbi:hypothetical protein LOZ39_006858, partial [Ophidiomyces ophidiicola]